MRTKVMIYSPMRLGVHWDSPWYRSHPGVSLPRTPETGIRSSRYHGARRVAYSTTHLRTFNESGWQGHQDDAETVAPFELQSHGRSVHAGRHVVKRQCQRDDVSNCSSPLD